MDRQPRSQFLANGSKTHAAVGVGMAPIPADVLLLGDTLGLIEVFYIFLLTWSHERQE